MWGIIISVFLLLYILMICYIGKRGWTILCKSTSLFNKIIYWFFFMVLAFSYPASGIFEGFLPETAGLLLTIWGGYSMIAVSYLFLVILFIDILRLIDKFTGFIPSIIREYKSTPAILSILVVISVTATLIYGGYNAMNPEVKEYEIKVTKNAGSLKQLKIAMVSDIHYGTVVNDDRIYNMVEIINGLKPDIILLVGDITEGLGGRLESLKLAEILGQMDSRYGIYAVPGNHDRSLRDSGSQLSLSFNESGINVLRDICLKVENSFYIIGRDDPGYGGGQRRKEIVDLMEGIDWSLPMILLDHQPVDLENAQQNGVDLQLSGHTHNGQIFPGNLVTSQIYEQDWGALEKGDFHLIVSCGYGTWGPPLRIGSNPEVLSITIKFNE